MIFNPIGHTMFTRRSWVCDGLIVKATSLTFAKQKLVTAEIHQTSFANSSPVIQLVMKAKLHGKLYLKVNKGRISFYGKFNFRPNN